MLLNIPYGHIMTYGEVAKGIGKPEAAQAIGNAVGHNPISLIIPCHRVVGADGSLTGYAGRIERKKWLLEREQYHFKSTSAYGNSSTIGNTSWAATPPVKGVMLQDRFMLES